MRCGSLFSGIGGFDLAARWMGWSTAWYSEIDPYCNAVMAHHFPEARPLGDITQIEWDQVEPVDVLFGGFPCQDVSVAGRRAGLAGERSGLWWEFVRAIRGVDPDGWLSKTSQGSLLPDSIPFSGAWPTSGTMRNGVCYQRLTSARPISGNGSGLLPTQTAMDADPVTGGDLYRTKTGTIRARLADGRTSNRGLATAVLWPTPKARDANAEGLEAGKRRIEKYSTCSLQTAVKLWPTPQARDGISRGAQSPEKRRAGGHSVGLADAVRFPTPRAIDGRAKGNGPRPDTLTGYVNDDPATKERRGTLNPLWVAWLMGYPTDWLNSVPWVTRSSRSARTKSFKRSKE